MAEHPHFLVTGGRGVVGSRLVPLLASRAPESAITAVLRPGVSAAWGSGVAGVGIMEGDLRDPDLWRRLPAGITHVFHLAADIPRTPQRRWSAEMARDNLLPLAQLLERSRAWSELRQVIYSSSVSIYAPSLHVLTEDAPKHPVDLYGAAKLAGEHLLACLSGRGVAVACLRYSSVYGRGQHPSTALPKMIADALTNGEILVYGDGTRLQDFVHADDAAAGNVCAFQRGGAGAFNIGSGVPTSMVRLARAISNVITAGTARVVLREDLPDTAAGLQLDISKATTQLGYQPTLTLDAGLERLRQEMTQPNE